jgi:uncharacterized damage-inducible protein DinB
MMFASYSPLIVLSSPPLRFTAKTTQEARMPIAQMLLPEFDQEVKSTRKLLECVPDGKFDFKPHEKSMTLGRLAAHVAEMPNYMIGTLSLESMNFTGEEKHFEPATRQELLDAFDKTVAQARELLAKATDEDLSKIWTLTYKGQQVFSMPRAAVLRTMVLSHLIHHRGQLGVYLRMNNVEFPGMYGPSADEMKKWEAAGA